MSDGQKIIGTLIPIDGLISSNQSKSDWGTFETGEIFLDWIKKSGQGAWEFLPIHETQLEPGSISVHVPSPYKSYGIGLSPKYLSSKFAQFSPGPEELDKFVNENKDWIEDYALFCALRDNFGTDDWREWGEGLKNREEEALKVARQKFEKEIDEHILTQWRLSNSYENMRRIAAEKGIELIGDLPFYLSLQSPLVWVYQDVFKMEEDGSLRYVSGVPNTPREHFGRQLWGHPLYDWEGQENKDKIMALWRIRFRFLANLFDMLRLDHVNAFFEYGMMDTANEENDKYVKGPGEGVFEELVVFCREIGLLIFAENAGDDRRALWQALDKFDIASSRTFRFALNEKINELVNEDADIATYPENSVAYTTTHDTETLLGFLEILTPAQKEHLAEVSGVEYEADNIEFAKNIRQAIISSPSERVIIALQDWLLTRDRINIPGTEKEVGDTNWKYRMNIAIEDLPTEF